MWRECLRGNMEIYDKNVLKERHLHAEQKACVGPLMESHLVLSPMIDLKFCTDKLINVQMWHLWKKLPAYKHLC